MKKCILYVLSFVLLSTGLSTALSDNTYAASIYDNAYQTTDKLILKSDYYDVDIDVSHNWSQLILTDEYIEGYPTLFRQGNNNATQVQKDNMRDSFQQATLNDGYWTVSNHCWFAGPDEFCDIYVSWSEDKSLNAYWHGDGSGVSSAGYDYRLVISQNTGGPGDKRYEVRWGSAGNVISNINNNTKSYIAYLDPNYPAGYEGIVFQETPPDSGGNDDIEVHKPNITWNVMDKNVTVYSDSLKNTAALEDYQIYWFISNTTFDTIQPSEPFALSGCTPADFDNNFTVPIYFDYPIQAYYADEDCNILQVDDEGNQLSDNMVRINIDGSNFSGSTDDHVAIIGEIPENAILKAIRKFRPNDGGLATLIFAPIEAIASLPGIVGTCSPISLPLLGQNVSLECIRPTIQNSPMGAVYSVISVIVTGMVTWFVAWRTFGTIKNIQDPQDDKVEVLNL